MGVLYFFTAILVLFIIKFIYDSYLTNNTEEKWQEFVDKNPDQKDDYSIFPKRESIKTPTQNNDNKKKSLLKMAINQGCDPLQVKELYLNKMREINPSPQEFLHIQERSKKDKTIQARELNIHPEDTFSGILESWNEEYFNEINSFDFFISPTSHLIQLQLIKTINLYKDFSHGIELINMTLESASLLNEDPLFHSCLFFWRAKCKIALEENQAAYNDLKEAIKIVPSLDSGNETYKSFLLFNYHSYCSYVLNYLDGNLINALADSEHKSLADDYLELFGIYSKGANNGTNDKDSKEDDLPW